ncbi:glycosyltransferase family 4 protein [Staphylococcus chromogenes]|nr:glycosyltransferase family 4 protein [Staphylococcus chromogenes]
MHRLLVVTNDFPPTVGGIQSYVRDYLATYPADSIVVLASTQDPADAAIYDADVPYRVVRLQHRVLLPTRAVRKRMQQLIAEEAIDTVWFPSSAPLGLLAKPARAAGATRVVASTHGHEVGWSMIPVARQLLRAIGNSCDAVTYISEYTKRRLSPAFGGHPEYVAMPSGVDADAFRRPDRPVRPPQLAGLPESARLVVCMSRLVPRKGQDSLLRVWNQVVAVHPDAYLILVGRGSYEPQLRALAAQTRHVRFTGEVSDADAKALLHHASVFAMPARTRGRGLDVEGLGIVYLEAQAAGVPVIAGNSGGAPETVIPETGVVVDGHDTNQLLHALIDMLQNDDRREAMATAGPEYVEKHWSWDRLGHVFTRTISG